jgi:aminoglycoside N3'-acetyltransferase
MCWPAAVKGIPPVFEASFASVPPYDPSQLPHGAIGRLPEFLSLAKERGHEFRQEFPPDCVPMVDGSALGSMQGLMADA